MSLATTPVPKPPGRLTTIAIDRDFADRLRFLAKVNGLSQSDQLVALYGDVLNTAYADMLARKQAELAGEVSHAG